MAAYEKLSEVAGYADADEKLQELTEEMYAEAQALYRENDMKAAKSLFKFLSSYEDSEKYIKFIDVHRFINGDDSSSGMVWVGGFVDAWINNRLPTSNEEVIFSDDITVAAYLRENFYFEDAAELLLSKQEIAEEFLRGSWYGDGYYFKIDEDGTSWFDLPRIDYGYYYEIEDGLYLKYPEDDYDATKPQFAFTAISPDCIEVYCYQNGGTYTLYRD